MMLDLKKRKYKFTPFLPLPTPQIEEQNKIAEIVSLADKEIELL